MNILVYDVAADGGGAATILEYYYSLHKKDKKNHYIYLLSTYHLDDTDNITVINVPNVRKGWGHRIVFDLLGARSYLREYEIEEVISLQNNILPCFHGRQIVYVHNALPFAEKRYSLFENRYLWLYQNIIGYLIKRSISKADEVIVQTHHMKKAICSQIKGAEAKVKVSFPAIEYESGLRYTEQVHPQFFYPANPSEFKNHAIIVEACRILKSKGYCQFKVLFTIRGNEAKHIRILRNITETEQLPVVWGGNLDKKSIFSNYASSILIFPSYIETIGLPLLEAMSVEAPMIVSDLDYAREVVGDYSKVHFFNNKDPEELAKIMAIYLRRNLDE